jgi:hypothetical protein
MRRAYHLPMLYFAFSAMRLCTQWHHACGASNQRQRRNVSNRVQPHPDIANAQCTKTSFSSPATRQWRRHCASSRQHRVQSPLCNADDPVITVSAYLCRRSCLIRFLILFPRFSVRLALRITPKDSFCLARRYSTSCLGCQTHRNQGCRCFLPSQEDLGLVDQLRSQERPGTRSIGLPSRRRDWGRDFRGAPPTLEHGRPINRSSLSARLALRGH